MSEPKNRQALVLHIAAAIDQKNIAVAEQAVADLLTDITTDLHALANAYRDLLGTAQGSTLQELYLARYFSGVIAEMKSEPAAAIEHFLDATLVQIDPEKPLQHLRRLTELTGTTKHYALPADLVFVTGGSFVTKNFHGHSHLHDALGGSESALIFLARACAERGHRVVVYCPCTQPGRYDGVEYRSHREFFFANALTPPKVLIASRFDMYLPATTRARRKLLWAHDVASLPIYNHLTHTAPTFDELICLSEYHRASWRERLALRPEQIFLTTNGFDPTLFSTPTTARKKQLIYTSRPSRGLDICVKVTAALQHEFPDLSLLACTYTPYTNQVADDPEVKALQQLLTQPFIHFHGGLDKTALARALQESLLMLYPNTSGAETSCIAAIEAMAAGCPVITSDRGALPETVPHQVGGIVVPRAEENALVESLAAAAATLLRDTNAREQLSHSARRYACERFPWSVVAEQWLQHLAPYLGNDA